MTSSSTASRLQAQALAPSMSVRERIAYMTDELLCSLPNPEDLSPDHRRGIIARYASVLEGNFIYWMTATLLSVNSIEARAIIMENLQEEIRDCHPGMMRRFALAAHAMPSEIDTMAVYTELANVRLFLGRLMPFQNLVTMAFFEGFIQRFMAYLADLAVRQGSSDLEYTDVHGVCDVTHTEELYHALEAEMRLSPPDPGSDLFEGARLLQALIRTMMDPHSALMMGNSQSSAN